MVKEREIRHPEGQLPPAVEKEVNDRKKLVDLQRTRRGNEAVTSLRSFLQGRISSFEVKTGVNLKVDIENEKLIVVLPTQDGEQSFSAEGEEAEEGKILLVVQFYKLDIQTKSSKGQLDKTDYEDGHDFWPVRNGERTFLIDAEKKVATLVSELTEGQVENLKREMDKLSKSKERKRGK